MGTTKLSKYEQETITNYNAEEQTATVYTRDRAVMRRLDTLVKEFPEVYWCIGETDIDKTYRMPKSYISYRRPRNISQKRREQAREHMKEINEQRNREVESRGRGVWICEGEQSGAERGSADDCTSGDECGGGKHIH